MKSHVSDKLLEVMQAIYFDACVKCAAKVSHRDLNTIRSRIRDEGLSFLTITLPEFCRDFERCLDAGFIDPQLFRRFSKSGKLPAFLQGISGRIFDRETGRINDYDTGKPGHTPHISDLVACVRQICLSFKKIKLPCTPERERKAMRGFIATEHAFSAFPLPKEKDLFFKRVSSVLWDNIIHGLHVNMLVPRHGPGQTAERISGNRKYVWKFWNERLEPYFPFLDTAYSSSLGEICYLGKELNDVTFVHSDDELPVRVVFVPKTLKAPRVIAIEPCCNQYTQQAISRALIRLLESSRLTSGHINFSDQTINGAIALTSSTDGRFATIDLSDASDRVPVGYALYMFSSNPDLQEAIESCRSTRAKLPSGDIIPLRKFASMGSALCFPIEAMYFYTLCVMALLDFHNLPVSHETVSNVSRDVYVYGDDIAIPTDAAATVLSYLNEYNCKVNSHKTFYRGKFRESCGVDAYDGQVVTPVYINRTQPRSRRQVKEILSWLSTANHFEERGYFQTAALLFGSVERVLGKLPQVPKDSPVLGRILSWGVDPPKKWNRRYQRMEIFCWVQAPVYRTDIIGGYAALSKSLLKLEGLSSLLEPRDPKHLTRSALHGEVAIKRRWVPQL